MVNNPHIAHLQVAVRGMAIYFARKNSGSSGGYVYGYYRSGDEYMYYTEYYNGANNGGVQRTTRDGHSHSMDIMVIN